MVEILRDQLVALGHPIGSAEPMEDLGLILHNAQRRRLEVRPRTVHRSETLEQDLENELGTELGMLLDAVERGEDLTPRLSLSTYARAYDDAMLNDWGIYHFHLGTVMKSARLMNRSGPLLFARVDDDDFYAICVLGHRDWSEQIVLEILNENWPNTVAPYQLKGAVGLSQNLSDDDVALLRKNGINAIVSVGGIPTLGPGGGVTTDGTSVSASREWISAKSWLRRLPDSANEWCATIEQAGSLPAKGEPIKFELKLVGDQYVVRYVGNGAVMTTRPYRALAGS